MTIPRRFSIARFLILGLCMSTAAAVRVSSQAPAFDESQIRAQMIVNLTKFIDWPTSRNDMHTPFVICAVGNDQVGSYLETLLSGKTVQGRAVLVRRGIAPEQVQPCHILYIPHPKHKQITDLSASLASASVLTISEENPARSGTVIGLPLVDGRVQIEINRPLAQDSTLTLSSHLLQIATERR